MSWTWKPLHENAILGDWCALIGILLKKEHIFIFAEYAKFKMIKYSQKVPTVQSDLLYAYIHIWNKTMRKNKNISQEKQVPWLLIKFGSLTE